MLMRSGGEDWTSAANGYAVSGTFVRPVVPDRAVLGASIIPDGNVVLAPLEAGLVVRAFHVIQQEAQELISQTLAGQKPK